jgi:hypothetical protein
MYKIKNKKLSLKTFVKLTHLTYHCRRCYHVEQMVYLIKNVVHGTFPQINYLL